MTYYSFSTESLSYQALLITRDLQADPSARAEFYDAHPKQDAEILARLRKYDDGKTFDSFLFYLLLEAVCNSLGKNKRSCAQIFDRASKTARAFSFTLHNPNFTHDEKFKLWDLFLQAIQKPDRCWLGWIRGSANYADMKKQLEGIINT